MQQITCFTKMSGRDDNKVKREYLEFEDMKQALAHCAGHSEAAHDVKRLKRRKKLN